MACACEKENDNESYWLQFVGAVKSNDLQKIKKLAKLPEIAKNDPLSLAVSNDKNKILCLLLQAGLNVNKSASPILNTPLHFATIHNNLPAMKMLLSSGADIEKTNAYKYTPFMTAMECGNEETIAFYLENFHFWKNCLGLHLWIDWNQCPLHFLLKNRTIDIVNPISKLLENGASPNHKNAKGNTPLLECIYRRDHEVTTRLIRVLANYNIQANEANYEGITPLFKIVTLDDPVLLKTLLEIPTLDINDKNMFGLTAIYYSISNSKNDEIIQILTKGGADPCILGAFTMRGLVTDTASAILAALYSERITLLYLFFEYGFVMKRKWFRTAPEKPPFGSKPFSYRAKCLL